MLNDVKVHMVESVEDAFAFLGWVSERRPVLAIDTETGGLSYVRDALRLVQFGDGQAGWSLSYRQWRGVIEEALRRVVATDQAVVFHNAKFDLHFLETAGLPTPAWHRVHDTKIMDHLIDPLRNHSLKPMAERVFGPAAGVGQGLLRRVMQKGGYTWATVPETEPAYWAYAAIDTILTARLAEMLWVEVNAKGLRPAYDREMAVQRILYGSEARGLRIDNDYTVTLRERWKLEMWELEQQFAAAGVDNPNAARQIVKALKAEGFEPDEFTPNGEPKLDKKVLEGLNSDLANAVLRYRRLRKWTSAYLDHFLAEQDPNGYVHPWINTMQAKTGRMSITGPPLQTLPRGTEIRDCVIPDEGKRIVAIDYDQMEAYVFAHFSEDPGLLHAIRTGVDLHKFVASKAYSVDIEAVTKDQRQISKNTGYGKMYGARPPKIAETAGVPVHVAEEFNQAYEAAFPGVPRFMKMVEGVARKRLATEGRAYITTWGGRSIPSLPDQTYALVNYLIQGTCADVFKDKLIELDAAGFGETIMLPVHDEVLFSFDADVAEEAGREAADIMTVKDAFLVPLTVAPSAPLDRWGTKYREDG